MRQKVAQHINMLMAKTIADADRLKSMPANDRPGGATINEVRLAYADCMEDLSKTYTSISQLNSFELPSQRLQEVNG
jgi:hypothetical protein